MARILCMWMQFLYVQLINKLGINEEISEFFLKILKTNVNWKHSWELASRKGDRPDCKMKKLLVIWFLYACNQLNQAVSHRISNYQLNTYLKRKESYQWKKQQLQWILLEEPYQILRQHTRSQMPVIPLTMFRVLYSILCTELLLWFKQSNINDL